MVYYEDHRLKIIEENGMYTVYDNKYRGVRHGKTKEYVDDFIQRVQSKRKGGKKAE